MEITIEELDVPLVTIIGEVDLYTCPELKTTLKRLTDAGHTHLILDMAQVPYVDSAALGVLVDTQRGVKEQGGDIYLTQTMPFVLRAFEITRLIRLFKLVENNDAALAAVRAVRSGSEKSSSVESGDSRGGESESASGVSAG